MAVPGTYAATPVSSQLYTMASRAAANQAWNNGVSHYAVHISELALIAVAQLLTKCCTK